MLKRSTITVAAIAACGVALAFGVSVVVQPLVADEHGPSAREESPRAAMPNAE